MLRLHNSEASACGSGYRVSPQLMGGAIIERIRIRISTEALEGKGQRRRLGATQAGDLQSTSCTYRSLFGVLREGLFGEAASWSDIQSPCAKQEADEGSRRQMSGE